jgi:hypothetical protein
VGTARDFDAVALGKLVRIGFDLTLQSLRHTINRMPAVAPPSVINGPGSDFTLGGAFWQPCSRWRIDLRGRQEVVGRLGLDLGKNALQRPNAVYGIAQQLHQRGDFFVR